MEIISSLPTFGDKSLYSIGYWRVDSEQHGVAGDSPVYTLFHFLILFAFLLKVFLVLAFLIHLFRIFFVVIKLNVSTRKVAGK